MFSPSLDFLRQAVSPRVCSFTDSLVKTGAGPATVHRVALRYATGHAGVPSVIVKAVKPTCPDDPQAADRERLFYTDLLPRSGRRQVQLHYVGVDPETQARVLVMEDLGARYRFPPPTHAWTREEAFCIVRAYAHLHVWGRDYLPPREERGWMWRMALQDRTWSADELLQMVHGLVEQGIWSPVPQIERLIERVLADLPSFAAQPATLLHNDVFPPNIALPLDLQRDAIILDWDMVGWGLAEQDLAYMFMLPFGNTAALDRSELLESYWAEREALEGCSPSIEERRITQQHADALWALSLLPVAHKIAATPYPAGSAVRAYWDPMFGVLHGRLVALSRDI